MVIKQQVFEKTPKKPKATIVDITEVGNMPNPFDEAHSDVQLAYGAFLEAREELAEAVKEQEEQGKQASRNAEKHYRTYQSIIEQAFKERETTERQALETYKKSVEKAQKIYRENTLAALNKCKMMTNRAWKASFTTLKANPSVELDRYFITLPETKGWLLKITKHTKKYLVVWFKKASNFVNTKLDLLKSVNS